MRALPFDYSRCAGRSLQDELFCEKRDACARYRTVIDADRQSGIADYQRIAYHSLLCLDGDYRFRIPLTALQGQVT